MNLKRSSQRGLSQILPGKLNKQPSNKAHELFGGFVLLLMKENKEINVLDGGRILIGKNGKSKNEWCAEYAWQKWLEPQKLIKILLVLQRI